MSTVGKRFAGFCRRAGRLLQKDKEEWEMLTPPLRVVVSKPDDEVVEKFDRSQIGIALSPIAEESLRCVSGATAKGLGIEVVAEEINQVDTEDDESEIDSEEDIAASEPWPLRDIRPNGVVQDLLQGSPRMDSGHHGHPASYLNSVVQDLLLESPQAHDGFDVSPTYSAADFHDVDTTPTRKPRAARAYTAFQAQHAGSRKLEIPEISTRGGYEAESEEKGGKRGDAEDFNGEYGGAQFLSVRRSSLKRPPGIALQPVPQPNAVRRYESAYDLRSRSKPAYTRSNEALAKCGQAKPATYHCVLGRDEQTGKLKLEPNNISIAEPIMDHKAAPSCKPHSVARTAILGAWAGLSSEELPQQKGSKSATASHAKPADRKRLRSHMGRRV